MRWLNDISDSMDMNLSKLWEMVKDREAQHGEGQGTQSMGSLQLWTPQLIDSARIGWVTLW